MNSLTAYPLFTPLLPTRRPTSGGANALAKLPRMSGDEQPSTTASHWRDANPALFTKERLEASSGTSTSFDTATMLALFVFVGVVVLAHYSAQDQPVCMH